MSLFKTALRSGIKAPISVAVNSMSTAARAGIANKVAVITASTDGIGFAIAQRLAKDGAKVVISSRKQANVDKALASFGQNENVKGITCHVGQKEDRKKLIDFALSSFGGIDILVSNAAVNPSVAPVLDCEEPAWDKIMDINLKCAFMLTKETYPLIEKRGGGSIIYVSSIAAYHPIQMLGAYSVSKTALLGLTRAAAEQLATSNIRVNCVCPGIIKTKFSSFLTSNKSIEDKIIESVPMNRLGVPHDISGVVSFLCSDDAAYITGENIPVAGGFYCGL